MKGVAQRFVTQERSRGMKAVPQGKKAASPDWLEPSRRAAS